MVLEASEKADDEASAKRAEFEKKRGEEKVSEPEPKKKAGKKSDSVLTTFAKSAGRKVIAIAGVLIQRGILENFFKTKKRR